MAVVSMAAVEIATGAQQRNRDMASVVSSASLL
jgi:hypothetical protein